MRCGLQGRSGDWGWGCEIEDVSEDEDHVDEDVVGRWGSRGSYEDEDRVEEDIVGRCGSWGSYEDEDRVDEDIVGRCGSCGRGYSWKMWIMRIICRGG